ncbi:MAG: hypothetical protein HY520_04125 [Candidatus Aenigmarchaeota archaeon]|nr:hypothetical protein [Candidatus Aenigmarchaeota archaeon]
MEPREIPEYLLFPEALARLELGEDDLKRAISAGLIRAFRDRRVMRLHKGDVEVVRKDLGITGEGYTLDEARRILGMGADQLQQLVDSGTLPSYRDQGTAYLGRFHVDRYAQQLRQPRVRLSFDVEPGSEAIEGCVVPGDLRVYPTAEGARSAAGEGPFFHVAVRRMK